MIASVESQPRAHHKIVVSSEAKRLGARRCRLLSSQRALTKYIAAAARADAAGTSAVRKALLTEAARYVKSAGKARSIAPLAAGLYATSLPARQRAGGFQGCLAALLQGAPR